MKDKKRAYQELIVSIEIYEDDVIRASLPIKWKDDWSGTWES